MECGECRGFQHYGHSVGVAIPAFGVVKRVAVGPDLTPPVFWGEISLSLATKPVWLVGSHEAERSSLHEVRLVLVDGCIWGCVYAFIWRQEWHIREELMRFLSEKGLFDDGDVAPKVRGGPDSSGGISPKGLIR